MRNVIDERGAPPEKNGDAVGIFGGASTACGMQYSACVQGCCTVDCQVHVLLNRMLNNALCDYVFCMYVS